MARRREERVNLGVPVRIWGLDARGKPFSQEARTLDITRLGARLTGVTVSTNVGDIIGVQHGNEKARFRVAWVGAPETPDAGDVGIHCVEPTKFIWGAPLPECPSEPLQPPRAQQEMAQGGAGRRVHTRFACEGNAEVLPQGSGSPLWAAPCDISLSGCYLETISPLPVNTPVALTLRVEEVEVHTPGVVRTSHPSVGMGIAFQEMSAVDRDRIARVVAKLEEKATGKAPAGPSPAAAQQNELSIRLQAATSEMKDIEQLLCSGNPEIDSRVLRDFRTAVDHARQIAWMVQQWLQLSAQQRDPFEILPQLEEEQVRFIAQVSKDVEMEVEANDINVGTRCVADMHAAVKQLHHRLLQLVEQQTLDESPPAEPAGARRSA